MGEKIRLGIVGYGNLGKGAVKALAHNPDFELAAIFTRRPPASLGGEKFVSIGDMEKYADLIDVMLMCGSSSQDLPEQVPQIVRLFNTVDSFDTHAKIPEHFAKVDAAARDAGKLALISVGWDPGLFSLMRVLLEAAAPTGKTYTFWGKGVSQGHSAAIRDIAGVADARQYTVPKDEALAAVRRGELKDFTPREMHRRDCYVVAEPGADQAEIERAIKTMPDYFAPYDTPVYFLDQESFDREHSALPHGGFVIRSGQTGEDSQQLMEFSLNLTSNPEFTSSILLCCCRAVWRLYLDGKRGAVTALDVPIGCLSAKDPATLRKTMV